MEKKITQFQAQEIRAVEIKYVHAMQDLDYILKGMKKNDPRAEQHLGFYQLEAKIARDNLAQKYDEHKISHKI